MRILFIVLMLISVNAAAQSNSVNLALPSSPQSFASDRVRAGQLECSQAIGSATSMEFGVVGILNQNDPYSNFYNTQQVGTNGVNNFDTNGFVRDVGVYARITIPIGKPKKRLDCSLLYALELRARALEIQKLESEIANLKNLKFANDE